MDRGTSRGNGGEYAEKRRQHRQVKRRQRLQVIWRWLVLLALGYGGWRLLLQPNWLVASPDAITIRGARELDAEKVRQVIDIHLPQPLFRLQPDQIAAQLKSRLPVRTVQISRHLFPAGLTIELMELQPVARASRLTVLPGGRSQEVWGLVDAEGNWQSQEAFLRFSRQLPNPSLRVEGLQPNRLGQWPELYRRMLQSPVKITAVDLRNPSQVMLQTELGPVRLGPYGEQFPQQLLVLDQMRQLPTQVPAREVSYIDLTNPDSPRVKVKVQPKAAAAATKP